MVTTTLISDLQALQRHLPMSTTQVTLRRDVFDEIVAALTGKLSQNGKRDGVMAEFMPNLTPTERLLMEHLHGAGGGTVAAEVFGLSSDETLWVHIRRLRDKIERYHVPFRVETVRGWGYRLVWVEAEHA